MAFFTPFWAKRGDPLMLEAYRLGDLFLAFAKQTGAEK